MINVPAVEKSLVFEPEPGGEKGLRGAGGGVRGAAFRWLISGVDTSFP